MKNLWLFLSSIFLLVSCSSELEKTSELGEITFSFSELDRAIATSSNSSKLVSGSSQLNTQSSSALTSNLEPSAILITIINASNEIVSNNQRITLFKVGNEFTTEPINLEIGDYEISAFSVINDENRIIYATPKANSELAQLVDTPLNIPFNVSNNTTTLVIPDVVMILDTDSPEQFGFVSFSFNVVETRNSNKQFAFITDTSDSDTGELRLSLAAAIPQGMMSVTLNKEMMSSVDAFVNLSGTSTRRSNAMIDIRVSDDGFSFTESGANVDATFPEFINDQFYNIVITWDATVTTSAPLVDVSINGVSVTEAPFPTESGLNNSDPTRNDLSSVIGGVEFILFRFGGGSAIGRNPFTDILNPFAGLLIDDLKIYNTSSGNPFLIFQDDFENYTVGDSLDPNATVAFNGPIPDATIAPNTPYSEASFQATVQTKAITETVIPTFEAIIQNGSLDEFTFNVGENSDAFDITPPSGLQNNTGGFSTSPYSSLWNNTALDEYINSNFGSDPTRPVSTSLGNEGTRGYRLNSRPTRLYQLFNVEPGVEYTISIDTRSETQNTPLEIFILNNEITTEVNILSNSDASFTVTNDFNTDSSEFTTSEFTFIASSNIAVFYARSLNTVDSSTEVFIDNIIVKTPGFNVVSSAATFPAVILNGDAEMFIWRNGDDQMGVTTTVPDPNRGFNLYDNDEDNADFFDLTPNATILSNNTNEGVIPSPLENRFQAFLLETWIDENICDNSNNPLIINGTRANNGRYAFVLDDLSRRMYQPFAVEVGVKYTVNLAVRIETENTTLELRILNDPEMRDELDLDKNSETLTFDSGSGLAYRIEGGDDIYNVHTFSFVATTNEVAFYAIPRTTVADSGPGVNSCSFDNDEIFIDDIFIETPGF